MDSIERLYQPFWVETSSRKRAASPYSIATAPVISPLMHANMLKGIGRKQIIAILEETSMSHSFVEIEIKHGK